MDDFIYKYRYLIGGILVFIILLGSGILVWNKIRRGDTSKENQTISELQKQNNELRAQLSDSSKNIAGTTIANIDDQSNKININTADLSELDKLPGIGPAKAADIIAYRESNGGFRSIEEINNVKGIGDKTFENLKDLITIEG